ncbi:MAG: bifunctional hydroxymethylpyrimidine kinase/phosphomethylpyrimidine kinase [Actinomycetaceae bacterium]|nr:bifunctional hydroxymethylpyrimidine kinase/phosphomethylpyrimidine kinase [Actinomycetaceae bacterium]
MTFAYTIAGSEATGGAGFQVDLKTFHELGLYGMGALTCIVSFDPKDNWNHRFVPVPAQIIADQIEAATGSQDLDTVKVGMLGHPETIEVVSQALAKDNWKNVVVDPVLICKGQEPGQALDTDNALREKIIPLATVVTPNLFETATLSGVTSITSVDDLVAAAKKIGELGPKYVVAKGGVDLPGPDAVDVLWDGEKATIYSAPKIGEERSSGAGCTLAAAITAELAKGTDIHDAVRIAKEMVTQGIAARVDGKTPFTTVWQGAYDPQAESGIAVTEVA